MPLFKLIYGVPGGRTFLFQGEGTDADPHVFVTTAVDSSGAEIDFATNADQLSGDQKTQIVNGDGVVARIDATTGAVLCMDYLVNQIHEGNQYYIQGYLELDDTDVHYVKLVTPDTAVWSHFSFDIKSTGICATTLDEGATGGMTGGAGVIPINNNRNSTNTSDLVLTSGVTIADSYDKRLENDKWGAAGFKQNIGGGGGRLQELTLKQGTTYLRTFTSGADSNIIQFRASWHEHANT